MLLKEAPQLPATDAEPGRQVVDAAIVQRTGLDQGQGARDGVRAALPGRRCRRKLRTAAQAGTKSGCLRRRGGEVEADVLPLR